MDLYKSIPSLPITTNFSIVSVNVSSEQYIGSFGLRKFKSPEFDIPNVLLSWSFTRIATSTLTVSDVPEDEDARRQLFVDVLFGNETMFQHSYALFSFYLEMSKTCILCFVFECHTDRWKCEGYDWNYILKLDPRLDLQGT